MSKKRNLRSEAEGRDCQIRSEKCNRNTETTVLCHVHKPSISGGMALKGPDEIGAWGCSACHDYVDGRGSMSLCSRITRDILLYEGVFRTQIILIDEEKLWQPTK
jgi:hypothetical protein